MEIRVNPTRMEFNRLKTRLKMAQRGHKLLKDKRDELMRVFLELVRENKDLRTRVEAELSRSFANFLLASAVMSGETLEEAIMYPKAAVKVDVETKNVMSVHVPKITSAAKEGTEGEEEDATPYGFANTSGELDTSIATLAEVLPHLLRLAELEKSVGLLADEIDKTRRRVNALEHVLIPQLHQTIKYISMKLDENERAGLTRLMKIKDIVRGED
ncbi:V-type ATP synthase subunit D [Dethiobacter alkaliphilus]|uniref:V-type ATP synthase subunit D n=1 Tax=Dethiobacter alkaliphilus TaxID=427926 RepID=UPI002227710B|nr:V-type ATP synthase subunit D [Dethiobacter alkaliphilus]MCW3488859.1 V-type ATP synthase subunit D [Dethiobacter alkaliphilus]